MDARSNRPVALLLAAFGICVATLISSEDGWAKTKLSVYSGVEPDEVNDPFSRPRTSSSEGSFERTGAGGQLKARSSCHRLLAL